jgi:site-specific recombinase XerD
MLEDMAVRRFSEATCRNYLRHIAGVAKFLGRSPDTATAEDVHRFQVHMTENGARPLNLNNATSAIRFFFGTTLDRPELARHLARVHYPSRVLSLEEVGRLLEAAPGSGLKCKAALSVAYGAGPRAGEVVMLRISDIDADRTLTRVEQGEGRKDLCHALTPAARAPAPVVVAMSLARLFVRGPRSGATGHATAAQPCLSHGRRSSGPRHVGLAAYFARIGASIEPSLP